MKVWIDLGPQKKRASGSDPARGPRKAGDAHCKSSIAYGREGVTLDAFNFFRLLFPEPPSKGLLGIGNLYSATWFALDDSGIRAAVRHAGAVGLCEDAYFHVCVHDQSKVRKRGRKASATFAGALWADIDFGKLGGIRRYPPVRTLLRCLKSLLIPPSVTIVTGSGLHCYWLFDEYLEATSAEVLARRLRLYIIRSLGDDYTIDSKWDASVVLRVPGTLNHKRKYRVRVWKPRSPQAVRRYKAEDIENLFDELSVEVPAHGVQSRVVSEEIDSSNPSSTGAGDGVAVSSNTTSASDAYLASLDAYVRQGIRATRPTTVGERHHCLCRFMVWAKGHPDLADAKASEALVYAHRWYTEALDVIGTKDWNVTRKEFLSGWPLIKWPRGSWKRARFKNAAEKLDPRAVPTCRALGLRARRMPNLISLCIEYASAPDNDGQHFYMSSYDAADFLGVPQPRAHVWLKRLVKEGVLSLIESGTRGPNGKANRYRLNTAALQDPVCES